MGNASATHDLQRTRNDGALVDDECCTPAQLAYLEAFDGYIKAGGTPADHHGSTPELRAIRETMFSRLQHIRPWA